jgi:hypothetical protein
VCIERMISVVDMATWQQAGVYGVRMPFSTRGVLFSRNFYNGSETHITTCSIGIGVLFRELRRPERDVDRSPPSTIEFRNKCCYTSTPLMRVHAVDRDIFTLYLYLYHVCVSV